MPVPLELPPVIPISKPVALCVPDVPDAISKSIPVFIIVPAIVSALPAAVKLELISISEPILVIVLPDSVAPVYLKIC